MGSTELGDTFPASFARACCTALGTFGSGAGAAPALGFALAFAITAKAVSEVVRAIFFAAGMFGNRGRTTIARSDC
jgi:hypothetical protein